MCTHLVRRINGRYSIRRRIPTDLIQHYAGRKEIVKALGTSDRREAERLCRIAGAELDAEFARVRAALANPATAAAVPTMGSPVPTAASGWLHQTDGKWQSMPAPDQTAHVNADEVASRTLAALRQRRTAAAAQGHEALAAFNDRTKRSLEYQEDVLRGDDEPMHSLSKHEGHRNALRAFLTGDGSVREQSYPTAVPARQNAPAGGDTSLPQLIKKWATERKPDKRTIAKAELAAERFAGHVGPLPVWKIEPRHIVEFKDKLLASGQTPTNTNKQLETLSYLLNFAKGNLLISANPVAGIRVHAPKQAQEKRIPFDMAALQAIFTCPIYANGDRPAGGKGEAAYWLPLLGLFSGARLEELCQLRPEDVYEDSCVAPEGSERTAWVIAVTDREEGQSVKNAGSRRRFPVHPELIRLGFVAYAQAATGRKRIFHGLKPDQMGAESGNWSKWFGKYLRKTIGVTDERMVFHSFRHKFKDAAREAEIPEDVSDAITGHSSSSVARKYGGLTYPLRPLIEAMNRYRIPGLVLPEPPGK